MPAGGFFRGVGLHQRQHRNGCERKGPDILSSFRYRLYSDRNQPCSGGRARFEFDVTPGRRRPSNRAQPGVLDVSVELVAVEVDSVLDLDPHQQPRDRGPPSAGGEAPPGQRTARRWTSRIGW
jgi:hypothetical protein